MLYNFLSPLIPKRQKEHQTNTLKIANLTRFIIIYIKTNAECAATTTHNLNTRLCINCEDDFMRMMTMWNGVGGVQQSGMPRGSPTPSSLPPPLQPTPTSNYPTPPPPQPPPRAHATRMTHVKSNSCHLINQSNHHFMFNS